MSSGSYFEGSVRSTALFALVTLEAWTTSAVVFIFLKHMPLTGGLLENAYYPTLCSALPWLVGCMFWLRVRKRGNLGILDIKATKLCYSIINNVIGITYIGGLLIGQVLFWALTRVK
jgi:hypothetical protein